MGIGFSRWWGYCLVVESSTVTVRLFAAARAAAGAAELTVTAGTVGELKERLSADLGPDFARVVRGSSVLVNGTVSAADSAALPNGSTVDILPPFAGG